MRSTWTALMGALSLAVMTQAAAAQEATAPPATPSAPTSSRAEQLALIYDRVLSGQPLSRQQVDYIEQNFTPDERARIGAQLARLANIGGGAQDYRDQLRAQLSRALGVSPPGVIVVAGSEGGVVRHNTIVLDGGAGDVDAVKQEFRRMLARALGVPLERVTTVVGDERGAVIIPQGEVGGSEAGASASDFTLTEAEFDVIADAVATYLTIDSIYEQITLATSTAEPFVLDFGGGAHLGLLIDRVNGRVVGAGTLTIPGGAHSYAVAFSGTVQGDQIVGQLLGYSQRLLPGSELNFAFSEGGVSGHFAVATAIPASALVAGGAGSVSLVETLPGGSTQPRNLSFSVSTPDAQSLLDVFGVSDGGPIALGEMNTAPQMPGTYNLSYPGHVVGLRYDRASGGAVEGVLMSAPEGQADIVSLASGSNQVRFRVSVEGALSGPVTIELDTWPEAGETATAGVLDPFTFAANQQTGSSLPLQSMIALRPAGFSYLGWVVYEGEFNGFGAAAGYSHVRMAAIFGEPTLTLPASLVATYTGFVGGIGQETGAPPGGDDFEFGGEATLAVDFSLHTLTGQFEIDRSDAGADFILTLNNGAFVPGGGLAHGAFAFDLLGPGGIAGDGAGRFYGPNAEEAGGVFQASLGATFGLVGGFAVQR